MLSVENAQKKILDVAIPLGSERLPIEKALSYYLVNDVKADRPIPPFNRVAMDGFAVRSSDFTEPTVKLRIKGKIQAGVNQNIVVNAGEAVKVMTGSPCPEGADAVVKVEHSRTEGEYVFLSEEKIAPMLNVMTKGEDADQGTVLLAAKSKLTAAGIAVCASVGVHEVDVFKKPQISIISTGTEIVPANQTPLPHQIRDCNSYAIRTMCQGVKIDPNFLGIGEDNTDVISRLINQGLQSDILVLTGGVSMGDFDYVPKLLAAAGVENIFHKINMKPGKPLWFGKSTSGTYVFGLPGNPVSAQTCFRLFVYPLIKKLSGSISPISEPLYFPLLEKVISKTSREHYIPGRIQNVNKNTFLEPVVIMSSGDYYNVAKSHGIFRCPSDINVLEKGSTVEFLPWIETF